ncbi:MAG: response regulator [Saprospiraceae bacterium]|nr:response regulator [Saprospiraceae bacterium]
MIIDDEQHCIDTLKWQLEEYCKNDIKIIGTYTDAVGSIPEIIRLKPELLFSDIKMPEMSGLELAARVGDIVKHIVFTTAFDKYAINAIKLSVTDYLLKPIDKDELIATIPKT